MKREKSSTPPHTGAPRSRGRRKTLTAALLTLATFGFTWLLPQRQAVSAADTVKVRTDADETAKTDILSVLLEVDTEPVPEMAARELVNDVRIELRKDRVRYSQLRAEGARVLFTLRKPDQAFVAYAALERLGNEFEIGKPDSGTWSIWPTESEASRLRERAVKFALVLLVGRITGVVDGKNMPLVRRVGTSNRILVQYPEGYERPNWDWSSRIIHSRTQTTFYLIEDVTSHSELDAGYEKTRRDILRPLDDSDDKRYVVDRNRSKMIGVDAIRNVDVVVNHDGTAQVEIRLKNSAKRRFASMTGRKIAIAIDGAVLAAPSVSSSAEHADILVLKGDLSLAYAKKLANMFTFDGGSARLKVVREWTTKAGYNIDEISGR